MLWLLILMEKKFKCHLTAQIKIHVFVKYENDRYSITCKLEEEKKPAKVKPVSRAKKQKKVTEVELADDVATDEQKDKSE